MRTKRLRNMLLLAVFVSALSASGAGYRDLAVLLAKGWFGRYVPAEATVSDCVAFLYEHGICFSLSDLADPARRVTEEDFAKAIGQSTLLFRGEALVEKGCIKKPEEANSWVDYCILNDIQYRRLLKRFHAHTD